ncbi:MAG: hypothetical protein IKO72_10635 [Kiritimatiellae bacterium]|nr:hypothetical protein [Kiritimatiellia bacterium]
MSLNLEAFRNIANTAWVTSRDIIVQGEGDKAVAKLGNYIFSQGSKANDATMAAFKTALENEYGVFGTHAFDTLVGTRNQLHQSLRAMDVRKVLSSLTAVKAARVTGEIIRQLDTSPKMLQLSDEMCKLVREDIKSSRFSGVNLVAIKDTDDIIKAAADRIDRAIADARKNAGKIDTSTHEIEGAVGVGDLAKPTEATGLKNLGVSFQNSDTSIEDQIKKGTLGVGMSVNRSADSQMILEKLKTNGVEPGFIYRNDWTSNDTRSYMAKIPPDADRTAILREGRTSKFGMAAVSELIIDLAIRHTQSSIKLPDQVRNLGEALFDKYLLSDLENLTSPEKADILKEIKTEFFTQIRDAVMSIGPKNADGTECEVYKMSPIFKHFNDRGIVKLDYNEGDRIFTKEAAHAGSFMRPERIKNRKLGQIYRLQTASSADSISAGAVTEALANDLTRVAGVPAQELQIVRGKYSDGHPKLMLAAKFADGYKDMEDGMIKDGRAVPPKNKDGSKGADPEPLGRFKAFFLVTADRDAVGRRGQNKGFINGRFFAIDPGHSLEGNGKYLEISDDLSFKDTYGSSTKPRFENFSVFDDDTRAAKFKGVLEMRELQKSGAFKKVFDDYRNAFDPKEDGISDAEKTLRSKIITEIDAKEREFNESINKLMRVSGMQLELHDDLKESAPAVNRNDAIETLSNLEKLTSPTTWVSRKGQVALNHLEVLPETRVPWRAHLQGDNLVYYCDKPLSKAVQDVLRAMLSNCLGTFIEVDGQGTTKVVVPIVGHEEALKALSEENVIKLTHSEEHRTMIEGGDRLKVAKTYVPQAPVPRADGKPLDSADLPEKLDISILGTMVTLRKGHFEAMVMNTPEAERPRSVAELKRFLSARVTRGNSILKALYAGKVNRFEPSRENITALTVAIHVAALKRGEYIYRGAFSVSDPNGNIARWLDTAPGLYQRTSTHAKPYQSLQVDGHLNMPRGYDVAPGMKGLLNGMRTFHYFTIPDNDHMNDVERGSGPNRRLYLKCETYGVFVNTIHAKFSKKADSRTEEMRTRGYEFGDICESIAHGASLFSSKFTSKNAEGIRKENLPGPVSGMINELERKLKTTGYGDFAAMALKGVRDGGGVRMLIENLNNALAGLQPERIINALVLVNDTLTEIRDAFENLNGDFANRMGNEVLVEPQDIY